GVEAREEVAAEKLQEGVVHAFRLRLLRLLAGRLRLLERAPLAQELARRVELLADAAALVAARVADAQPEAVAQEEPVARAPRELAGAVAGDHGRPAAREREGHLLRVDVGGEVARLAAEDAGRVDREQPGVDVHPGRVDRGRLLRDLDRVADR